LLLVFIFLTGVWCLSLGDALAFAHPGFLTSRYCISYHIGDNVSFKLEGGKYSTVHFFLSFVVCDYFILIYIYISMLLINRELHCNCGFH
jgi:hypothetical protein